MRRSKVTELSLKAQRPEPAAQIPEIVAIEQVSEALTWPESLWSCDQVVRMSRKVPRMGGDSQAENYRRHSLREILSWLEMSPGESWQERWLASGAEQVGRAWAIRAGAQAAVTSPKSPEALRRRLVRGVGTLLALGVVRPGYQWLLACAFNNVFSDFREVRYREFFEQAASCAAERGVREQAAVVALNHLTRIAMHLGKSPRAFSEEDFFQYRESCKQANGMHTAALTWDMLRWTGVLPPETPELRVVLRRGQPTMEEIVDYYDVTCQPVRELLIRYLTERSVRVDFTTIRQIAINLVGDFWKDLERHHPGIDSLVLTDEMAAAWRERAAFDRRGKRGIPRRRDTYKVFFIVRAFYLDIMHWAAEDASWAPWVARCPVREQDVSGFDSARRRTVARMHQRTRVLVPLLPVLVGSAEQRLEQMTRLLEAARAVAVGDAFTEGGVAYQRTQARWDALNGKRRGPGRIRIECRATGELVDVERAEDDAFWSWAIIETLRHTGLRMEEMLELTHLALSRYTVPDSGEVVPLLQVVPSKSDEERLLLVSPELAHVLAQVVARVRGGEQTVPLLRRYDAHERVTSPPLPFLFQRRLRGYQGAVLCATQVYDLLRSAVEHAGLVDAEGNPLYMTAHDFRRIFATEAVSSGLPIHIAAKLLGHRSINTTQGYAAIYQDDVMRHHRALIAKRRALRPSSEYREPTDEEWTEFEQHFTKRKVELGTCARPYGTPCQHEHACIRCPMLRPDPRQEQRLLTIIINLNDRMSEAHNNGWLGEVEGLKVSLDAAHRKLEQMRNLSTNNRIADLPIPRPVTPPKHQERQQRNPARAGKQRNSTMRPGSD